MNSIITREIWADIEGYDGRYQISNHGNVRSLPFRIEQVSRWGYNVPRVMPGRIMTATDNGHGYLIVGLRKNNVKRNYYVHRLVAEAFCSKEGNADEVNHIDANPRNNRFDNLEWVTHQENINQAVPNMKHPKCSRLSASGEKYIHVRNNLYRLVIKGKVDRTYKTINEAVCAREVVLNGGQHHAVE